MGRKATVNTNLPAGVRKRMRTSGGRPVAYYFYDLGGKPRKEIALGSDLATALAKWSELSHKQATMPIVRPTFIDLKREYISRAIIKKAPRTQKDNLRELEVLSSFFANPPAPLDEIRPLHVRQFMDWRASGGKGAVRANREKALLSHMMNFARENGLLEGPNPCTGVRGFSEKGRSSVYVEDHSFEAVLKHADKPTAFAMRLAYLTGQRPGDLCTLKTTAIKDGAIVFNQAKTGQRLRIQIEGELEALLNEIEAFKKEAHSINPAILCNEKGEALSYNALRIRFDKARAAAGLTHKEIQIRDLRAKAATDKAESSGDIRQAQQQLGHKRLSMTEHYTRQRKGALVKPTK